MKKLLALLLALAMAFSFVACEKDEGDDRSDDRDSKPSSGSSSWLDNLFSSPDDDDDEKAEDNDSNNSVVAPPANLPNQNEETVSAVVTVGKHKLSSADFAYFYRDAISEYQQIIYEQYYATLGDNWYMLLGFDPELPLDEQIYNTDTGETWQDFFKDAALEDLHRIYVLYDEAIAHGHTLSSDEQLELSEYFNNLKLYASYYGYDDAEAYLRATYGQDADLESFQTYFTDYTLASSYFGHYTASLSFTDADYRAYEQSHDGYAAISDVKLVNVRHILALFAGNTDADKVKAKTKAEQWLRQWQEGAATEASFAELANAESEDRGGNVTDGGIYEDIYPGQMVKNFEDWCFDPARKPGDTGIVETEYGYHVMYFSAYGDITYRDMVIDNDMRMEYAENWAASLEEKVTLTVGNLDDLELE